MQALCGGQKQGALKIVLEARLEKAGVGEATAGCTDWLPTRLAGSPGWGELAAAMGNRDPQAVLPLTAT